MESSVNKALRLLEASIGNISQHVYDDFVERNVKSAFDSGMKAVIIRRQMFKCCDYCAKLSGIYDYAQGDYPDDIFTRHANCRCLVSVKTEKTGGYQDVWSKKEYRTQKQIRQAREKEILAEDKNYQKYLSKKEVAKAEGKKFADVTEYWENKPKEYPVFLITRKGQFEFRGETYKVGDRGVKPIPGDKERKFAEWWCDRFGGEIVFQPRILYPQKIKTPDYIINGIEYDLKSPTGDGKWVIKHQIEEAEGQADRVLIDLSESELKNKKTEMIRQVNNLFIFDDFPWLREAVISADEKILYVIERV